jgi:superfamily II DNA or RNA helicase
VRIYRFPDPDYADFRQVVIFAVKRAKPEKDDAAALRIAQAKTTPLPVLPATTDMPYTIPPVPDRPFYFRPAEADPKDVLAEAHAVGVWNTKAWADLLTPRSGQAVQPLMPLRRGHIAMVLAAGLLDNMAVEREGTKLLVKGRLRKVQVDVTDQKDREQHIKRTREQFEASITTLDLDTGQIVTLNRESSLKAWLTEWQDVLACKIVETFKPLHRMAYDGLPHFHTIVGAHSRYRRLPGRARTGLFEAQKQVVAALARRFLAGHRFAILQAMMGTGKTSIAASLADVLKKYLAPDRSFPVIVVCPPHLVEKWPREITGVVPMARAVVVRRPGDLEDYVRGLHNLAPGTLSVAVVSSEMLKLGSGWTAGVVRQRGRYKRLVETVRDGRIVEEIQRLDTFACPRCGQTIYHRDEVGKPTYPVTDPEYFSKRRVKCDNRIRRWVGDPDGMGGHWDDEVECGEPLYQDWRGHWPKPERDGFGHLLPLPEVRYPIAQYIRRRYDGLFQLAIIDECHEYKSQSTDRGHAFGTLVRASKRTLAMTGTLFGGFATSLFYLLHRLDPRIRAEFDWSDGQRFASLYGVLERMVQGSEGDSRDDEYGVYSGLRRRYTRVIERPGISPALATRLLDSTVFLTLEDLGFDLPNYAEYPVVMPMIQGDGTGPDQAEIYRGLHDTLLTAAREDWSLMSEYLQTTLAWPNACWRDEETSVITIPALSADRLYPKEQWLVEKCWAERQRGRRVLVYVRQTATRDIQPRLARLLRKAGLRVTILRGSVSTHRREAWVRRQVRDGLDVMICNPRLVQTGLDLVDFATVVFYEIEYSIYLVQQASRRTWRLGQTEPVEVYFAVYADTMEHRAVAHVGRKVAAAQLLYGDDVAGALVDQAGVGGSFLEELAREVVANSEISDLGELFVQKHRAVEGSGWLLGADGPDFSEQETHTLSVIHRPELASIDPGNTVQLSLL